MISAMLRISRRTDYAVRMMIAVARAPHGTFIPTPQIGAQQGIPQPFLAKVAGDLKRGGLILTAPGRSGGVSLTRPATAITLRHIVEAVEGPIVLNAALVQADESHSAHRTDPVQSTWQHIQQVLESELDAVTLAALAAHARQA